MEDLTGFALNLNYRYEFRTYNFYPGKIKTLYKTQSLLEKVMDDKVW